LFSYSSIDAYHALLLAGQVSCRQVVEHYLQAICAKKHLNAFVDVYAEEALQKADELDLQRRQGKPIKSLHGVVVALKDVIAYNKHRLTAASKILKNFHSIYSATVVKKLLQEEVIIIGNCNCDEFAMGSTNENSFYGPVLNAAAETCVPGGSSGGSAVAVQAGLCMISLGSDTGGSVRQPADFCGIVGLKPTYGRISRHGLVAFASSFDSIGLFAKNVHDIAKVLSVIAGPDEFDSTVSQKNVEDYTKTPISNKKFRFAYFQETLQHPVLDSEISSSLQLTIKNLMHDGHTIEPAHFEYLDYIVPAYYVLTTAEASSNLARYDGVRFGYRTEKSVDDLTEFYTTNRSEGFGKEVKRRIMLGSFVLSTGYYDAYFTKAQQVRRLVVEKIESVFKNYDFILMPTAPSTAFMLGKKITDPVAVYLSDIFTVTANLTGCPAISLPLFKHSNGLPFGLQLLANRFNELSLLQVSKQLLQHS